MAEHLNPKARFWTAYQRVCAGLKQDAQANQPHASECFRVVEAFDPASYEVAASRMLETCRFLPTPAEWRQACAAIADDWERARLARSLAQADALADEPTYHCTDCQDTGFAKHTCPDGLGTWCGICRRQKRHPYDHTYVTPCGCRETNPVVQAKLARAREQGRYRNGGKG